MQTQPNTRILALDILRGITIAGMILVNNPGGEPVFKPLEHAEWLGLTPTDLVFPFFMFIMGITTYLSLHKYQHRWSTQCFLKILKRTVLLYLIGLLVGWVLLAIRLFLSPDLSSLPFFERLYSSFDTFGRLRLVGVFPRLAICYGLASVIVMSFSLRRIMLLIGVLFVGYALILQYGNGYAHDANNICNIVDEYLLGRQHLYRWDVPDPEGLLSTLPALSHVLIGYCVGANVMQIKSLHEKVLKLFIIGTILTFVGFLLIDLCPLSKKLWTPTFSLVTCGFASLSLALLTWLVDIRRYRSSVISFFHAFGVNPLALYLAADLLLIPLSMIPIHGQTIQTLFFTSLSTSLHSPQIASLLWALCFVGLVWIIGYYFLKKQIYIKL